MFDEAIGDQPLEIFARRIKRKEICDGFGNFFDGWYFSSFRSRGDRTLVWRVLYPFSPFEYDLA